MAQVFISYSSKHRNLTEQLATFLESCGLDVWWDRALAARGPFDPQIKEELRKADCVVVLWTLDAIKSEWVKIEADYAYDNGSSRNKLVSVTANDVDWRDLPPPYNTFEHHRPFETDLILRDVLAVREGRLLLEDKRDVLPHPHARTPTMLLQAKFNLIPFTGNATCDDLVDWALGRYPYSELRYRAAGRLFHGPGGLGKTRLLIEVTKQLRDQGWSAGFLTRPDVFDDTSKCERRAKALGFLIRGASDRGLLLILDYAESRYVEIRRLAQEILGRPPEDVRPIRLVLLSRGVGDWWTQLVEEDQNTLSLFGGQRLDVHALEGISSLQARHDFFCKAVEAFAPRLAEMGYTIPADREPSTEWLHITESNKGRELGDGYDRPLAIAMEALLYLAATTPGSEEPGAHPLLASVLGLERAHWPKLVGNLDYDSRRDPALDLRRAVAQVTLMQGIEGRRRTEDLLMEDRFYKGHRQSRASVQEVINNISKIYGGGDVIAPMEPDLVGEHHVGTVADQELLEGCLAWISAAPRDAQSDLRLKLLSVLQRASRPDHGSLVIKHTRSLLAHLIQFHSDTLAAEMVMVMANTPGALLEILNATILTMANSEEKNPKRRQLCQIAAAGDESRRLGLARDLARGRIRNQIALLARLARRQPTAALADQRLLVGRALRALSSAIDENKVLGLMGQSSGIFWSGYSSLFSQHLNFYYRTLRDFEDPVNPVLSQLNDLLIADIGEMACQAGLDLRISVLHLRGAMEKPLAKDLALEFKAPIVEYTAFRLFRKKLFVESMLIRDGSNVRIGSNGVLVVKKSYEERLNELVRSPHQDRLVTWRELMREQVQSYLYCCECNLSYSPYLMDY